MAFCIPCVFFSIATDCMKKYLQAQSIVKPGMYATGAATLLAPVFFYTFVHGMGLGLDGAAMAFILCQVSAMNVANCMLFPGERNECY